MTNIFPADMGLSVETDLVTLAARQRLEEWIKSPKIAARIQSTIERGELKDHLGPFVTVSREAGAGGGQFAEHLAERLGWDALDKQLLDFMAERFDKPRQMVDIVDETAANWVHDALLCWFDPKLVTHQKYVANLGKFITLAACHGKVVLVGRGAQFILPPGSGVAVRVVASRRYRVAEMARRRDLPPAEAEKIVDSRDQGRRDFCQRHFQHDITDSHLYDVVVNIESLGLDTALDVVERICRSRFD